MAGLVEEDVLIGLDDDQVVVVEVLGQPARGDELLRMGILGQLGIRIVGERHRSRFLKPGFVDARSIGRVVRVRHNFATRHAR
jgi:hypothetical protein